MPITRTSYVAGVNVEDSGFVRLRWSNAELPIPRADAPPRQILDFAAVVALDGRDSSGMVDLGELVRRAVEAYRREHPLSSTNA